MLVRERMSKNVVVTAPDRPLAEIRNLLQRRRFRQMPVVADARLVGIITDRDLRSAGQKATVGEVMSRALLVIAPSASVDEAAGLLRKRKINALPVVDGEHLLGIITVSDVLEAFIDLSGVAESSYRLVLAGARTAPALRKIREIVERQGGELMWTYIETASRSGSVHVRLKTRRLDELTAALESAGFEVSAVIASGSRPPRRPGSDRGKAAKVRPRARK